MVCVLEAGRCVWWSQVEVCVLESGGGVCSRVRWRCVF